MRRIYAFFIFMAIFSAMYQLGAMSPVTTQEAEMFLEEFEKLVEGIDAVGIFVHNTSLALPMFIPGFGMVWGMFSAWSTGYAFASIVVMSPALSEIPPLAILYLSPFGLMELSAYSLGVSRSYILLVTLIRKKPLRPHMLATAAEVGIVVGLLLAGGFIEFHMIEMVREDGFELF